MFKREFDFDIFMYIPTICFGFLTFSAFIRNYKKRKIINIKLKR